MLEEALEDREDNERPGVADMDAVVDRRPARVDRDLAGLAGLERQDLARPRVVDRDRPQDAGNLASADRTAG
jgi:hypothetical protein